MEFYAKRKYGVKIHKKPVYTCPFFYLTKQRKRYIITLLSSAGGPRERVRSILLLLWKELIRRERVSKVHSGRKTETSKKTFQKVLDKEKKK